MDRRRVTASVYAFLIIVASFCAAAAPSHAQSPSGGSSSAAGVPGSGFHRGLGFRLPPDYDRLPKVDLSRNLNKSLPARWDWREHDGLTPVKDQGQCGSCWAFASVAAFEACARIDDHEIYDLSEQQLISCNTAGYGCNGGWFEGCYEVFHDPGAVSEECMPYQAADGVICTQGSCVPVAKASAILYIENTVESIKAAVYDIGPIAVGLMVHEDFFGYGGGYCYQNYPYPEDPNHAVVIVGWDDAMCDGNGAWICKNSWSEMWGDNGYFTIRYGYSSIGTGAAAFIHIPGRTVTVEPVLLPSTSGLFDWFIFTADVHATGGVRLDPSAIRLLYRVSGEDWQPPVPMMQAASRGPWFARIPAPRKPATIDYCFHAADVEGHEGCAPLFAPDSTYTFDYARVYEDFEGSNPGWTVGGPDDDATTGIWECVEPIGTAAQPDRDTTIYGTRCWVTGQQPEGNQSSGANDVDGGQTTLRSPAYDLIATHTAIVKYRRWFSNDKGAYPGEDPWIVQARNNSGPWIDIENTIVSNNAWIPIRADLKALFGDSMETVEFRFIAQDRGGPSCVEAAIDDFTILAEQQLTSVAAPVTPGPETADARAIEASPNPTAGGSRIAFTLARPGAVRLSIYAAGGRRVRRLTSETMEGGRHEIFWDGRDDAGRPAASGAYYCVSESRGARQVQRVLIIR